MKKTITLGLMLCMCTFASVTAQKSAGISNELKNQLADETCHCLEKVDIVATSAKDLEAKMGACIEEAMMNHLGEIAKQDPNFGKRKGKEFGTELAMIMLSNCQTFTDMTLKMTTGKDPVKKTVTPETKSASPSASTTSTASTTGTIKRIESGEFVTLVVEDENKREVPVIWLSYFPESEQFTTDTEKLKGKKVTISWIEKECYLPKAKGYYKVKEITGLSVQN